MSKARAILGQTGFSKKKIREPEDFYITPDLATLALLEREAFIGVGWEPACGNGAIVRHFPGILASDIRSGPDIAGANNIDFLTEHWDGIDFIVTNPPFKKALPFVKHALEYADKVAMFLRLQFLEGQARYQFFQEHPPIRIYVFSDRLNADPAAPGLGGMMCFAWFVWEKNYRGKPMLDWIKLSK